MCVYLCRYVCMCRCDGGHWVLTVSSPYHIIILNIIIIFSFSTSQQFPWILIPQNLPPQGPICKRRHCYPTYVCGCLRSVNREGYMRVLYVSLLVIPPKILHPLKKLPVPVPVPVPIPGGPITGGLEVNAGSGRIRKPSMNRAMHRPVHLGGRW